MRRFHLAASVLTAAVVGALPVEAGHAVHQAREGHKDVHRHVAMHAHAVHARAAHATRPGSVSLALDEVHTLTFRTPIATVYVGNPAIADVTMVDARHAFVQGKGYGHTNIIALNHDGAQVFASFVNVVGNDGAGTVILNRGLQRVTYSCVGRRCEPTPQPGDSKDSFELQAGQMNTHQDNARKASGPGG